MCQYAQAAVTELVGYARQLSGEGDGFVQGVRSTDGPVAAAQYVGERRLVVDSSRHLECLACECGLAVLHPGIGRQAAHQLRAKRAVVVAERGERSLQQAGDRPGHRCGLLEAVW
jgi:hypothetical protein